jgi:signal transduction histidine kinase
VLDWLLSVRLRLLFRCAFLLLLAATLGMALYLLREEKELSLADYRYGFERNAAQIAATLRHPTGQLALLNPQVAGASPEPAVHPVLLPYAALDFDDRGKVQQAIEMAGCLAPYKSGASLCVALGNSPWAGGFVYAAGYFLSPTLVAHERGDDDFTRATRLKVLVNLRGEDYRWIAPFESMANGAPGEVDEHGRLTGFTETDEGHAGHPDRDFRGWIWQSARCAGGDQPAPGVDCQKRVFFSLRLPIAALRDALFEGKRPSWPPSDMNRIAVHITAMAPGDADALFDSADARDTPRFALADLSAMLMPGETLSIQKHAAAGPTDVVTLHGAEDSSAPVAAPIARLIRALPVAPAALKLESHATITTPSGPFELTMHGDARSVERKLAVVVARVAWFEAAVLMAIFVAWIVIELGIVRRITVLKRRAEAVSADMGSSASGSRLDLSDLRGADELGILAACLADLLHRVHEDAERERNRLEQEKDMWHAVGHEIVSPLQSLLALHGDPDGESNRYVRRMQQAVRVLYGSASPSEAFESQRLEVHPIELGEFLANVARNARFVDVENVSFTGMSEAVVARADEYSLEDVITHVLRNADRHRTAGSTIDMVLEADDLTAHILIRNDGTPIAADWLDKIFEYGVSGPGEAGANGRRGQGLFVARTYMGKMGGTIRAANSARGVEFRLTLPRSARTLA